MLCISIEHHFLVMRTKQLETWRVTERTFFSPIGGPTKSVIQSQQVFYERTFSPQRLSSLWKTLPCASMVNNYIKSYQFMLNGWKIVLSYTFQYWYLCSRYYYYKLLIQKIIPKKEENNFCDCRMVDIKNTCWPFTFCFIKYVLKLIFMGNIFLRWWKKGVGFFFKNKRSLKIFFFNKANLPF